MNKTAGSVWKFIKSHTETNETETRKGDLIIVILIPYRHS